MNDYEDYNVSQEPEEGVFKELNDLVISAKAKKRLLAELEEKQKKITNELNDILFNLLPTACEDMGLKKFTTVSGEEIEIKEETYAHISEEHRQDAILWLDNNGHSGIVKREISVAFNKDEQDQANNLLHELDGRFASLSQKKVVHPQTLKAWVKEMANKGRFVPTDLFGVRKIKVAKI